VIATYWVLWHWPHFLEPISHLWLPYNEKNGWAAFMSSWGGATAIFTGVYIGVRHANCHARWCLRIGKHQFRDPETGELYKLCAAHHPSVKPKARWWHRRRVHSLEHIHAQIAKGPVGESPRLMVGLPVEEEKA
jgi:hypothetical protein